MDNNLRKLAKAGQSPWYDNIERRMIKNGELKKLFESGILGVTSNPTIFEKAINGSADYDEQIMRLTADKKTVNEIYDELTCRDILDAADLLLQTYQNSKRLDGYVSIEVLPEYAHAAAKTIDYARYIFKKINRPNIMIKVPGTEEAPEAIETLISEGINVNVTLLFSTLHYEKIVHAYFDGLKRNPGDLSAVNSVASLFVSRIDTYIDKMLEELASQESDAERKRKILDLCGKAAVAEMKCVYHKFLNLFLPRFFGDLAVRGANVQRVLWASTSTKNPAYPETKYVDELVAPNTINTLPHSTLIAVLKQGKTDVVINDGIREAIRTISDLSQLGIEIHKICQQIQDDGVAAFQKSFDNLIEAIKKKSYAATSSDLSSSSLSPHIHSSTG